MLRDATAGRAGRADARVRDDDLRRDVGAGASRTGSINLGQGFPDTDGPPELLEAARRRRSRSGHNQYPPGPGIPELRAAIAEHQRRHYGLSYDPDTEVLVTAGATEAIAAAVLALAEPGRRGGAVRAVLRLLRRLRRAGRRARGAVVTLRPRRRRLGASTRPSCARAITARTTVILLNTPHNPTGTVFTPSRARADRRARDRARPGRDHRRGVRAPDLRRPAHVPIATLPGMRERTVTICSAGKTFSVTGWKIGWVCAPPALLAAVRTVKQFLTYVSGAPFQPAVAAALARPSATARWRRRCRPSATCSATASPSWASTWSRPQATYFATVDVGRRRRRVLPRAAARGPAWSRSRAASSTTRRPATRYVRFAFCKRPEVLRRGADRSPTPATEVAPMKVAAIQHDIVWEDAAGDPRRTSRR